ncbi:MAG TPA: Uma2 family endonuclease, partial [Chitinophagaceae bacterium]|nr:Uma2 family endonuclease [Chitinophagaceae bacterium]
MSVTEIVNEFSKRNDFLEVLQEAQHRADAEKEKRNEYYNLVHENIKAEFINGEIVYQSPVVLEHWNTSANLSNLMIEYVKKNQLGKVGVEKVIISLSRNDYEPDIVFFSKEKTAIFKQGQLKFPAPDLVVEIISKKTEQTDRTIKFEDYAAHGIQEYWLIDSSKKTFEQYLNQNNSYTFTLKLQYAEVNHSASIKCLAFEL